MSTSQVFRKDIQGLRGLAVGLVVLEHATPLFPGGYIGVDVFFVISGFVITQLLLREIETRGSVSLVDFYSRRVRRLIPALAIVLMFSLVGSVFVLSPGLEQEKAVSAALASFFFVANIRYILEGDTSSCSLTHFDIYGHLELKSSSIFSIHCLLCCY